MTGGVDEWENVEKSNLTIIYILFKEHVSIFRLSLHASKPNRIGMYVLSSFITFCLVSTLFHYWKVNTLQWLIMVSKPLAGYLHILREKQYEPFIHLNGSSILMVGFMLFTCKVAPVSLYSKY